VLPLAVLGQVVGFDFVNYDDPLYVTDNYTVQRGLSPDTVAEAFTGLQVGLWHPVTWLSHMADCTLFGLAPRGHHATSLLLHTLNVLLLYTLLRRITDAPIASLYAAALFAVHPLCVEPVAWIASRKDVLSTTFFLLMLLGYVRFVATRGVGAYLWMTAAFVLGLLAKPMLITAPVLLLLLDGWPLQRPDRGLWPLVREKLPLFILAVVFAVVALVSASSGGSLRSVEEIGLANRVLNPPANYAHYLAATFWPSGLATPYPLQGGLPPWGQIIIGCVLLIGGSLLFIALRKKKPWLLVGWAWFIVALSPVSGVVQVGAQATADRYMYLPLIGMAMAVAWAVHSMTKVRSVFTAGAICSVALLSFLTWNQTQHWRDSISLMERALAVTEDNVDAHVNLGVALNQAGQREEALRHFEQALDISPNNVSAISNIGVALKDDENYDAALAQLQRALDLDPEKANTHNLIGMTLSEAGKPGEAIAPLERALELDPDLVDARCNLGSAQLASGQVDAAVANYEAALAVAPRHETARSNLGAVRLMQGDMEGAAAHLRIAVEEAPEDAVVLVNYAVALHALGRTPEAVGLCEQAKAADPDYDKAQQFLDYIAVNGGGAG
jgi:tetratricopeptide (TPR) repeat protein